MTGVQTCALPISKVQEDTVYVKALDHARLIGNALYALLSGSEPTPHKVNNHMIVEGKVLGNHLYELTDAQRSELFANPNFVRNKIKNDVLSFKLGLDDLTKEDNYVVGTGGNIVVIDFDVMDAYFNDAMMEQYKAETCSELGISSHEYDELYKFENYLFDKRVHGSQKEIGQIIQIAELRNYPDLATYLTIQLTGGSYER